MPFRRLLVASALLVAHLPAQQAKPATARDSVLATVTRLFDGMRALDTTVMRSTLAPGAMMSGVPAAGRPIKIDSADGWIASIGRAKAGSVYDEKLFAPEVRIDDGLATVWVEYTFVLNGKVSHCGMDAMQLVRSSDGWKITFVADTRRTTGCKS